MREDVITYEARLKICVGEYAVKKCRDLHVSDALLGPLYDLVTLQKMSPLRCPRIGLVPSEALG